MYYMGQLLPIFMVFYLVVAWFIYLRRTSFLQWGKGKKKQSDHLGHHESDMARGFPEDKMSGEELRHLRDEAGLIFRQPQKLSSENKDSFDADEVQNGSTKGGRITKRSVAILLWSSVQLGVIATLLYHLFGLGANYY